MTRFERGTAVESLGGGAYRGTMAPDWFAPLGPNGGYIAAVVVRAFQAEVADPDRAPRSLTLHYLRPPAEGEVRIEVTVERAGRRLTSLSARLVQDGNLCVVALGALATEFPSPLDYAEPPPAVPPADERPPARVHPLAPPIAQQLDVRPIGDGPALLSGADEALVTAWVRLAEPSVADAAAVALYTDALVPTPWTRLRAPSPAPTVDLTIHFRTRLPLDGLDPGAHLLAQFSSSTSEGGYFEEDGRVWAPDGTLLAQSRQLALLLESR